MFNKTTQRRRKPKEADARKAMASGEEESDTRTSAKK
jgi:hypothetical protein